MKTRLKTATCIDCITRTTEEKWRSVRTRRSGTSFPPWNVTKVCIHFRSKSILVRIGYNSQTNAPTCMKFAGNYGLLWIQKRFRIFSKLLPVSNYYFTNFIASRKLRNHQVNSRGDSKSSTICKKLKITNQLYTFYKTRCELLKETVE